jgi:hypothetical protein
MSLQEFVHNEYAIIEKSGLSKQIKRWMWLEIQLL